MFEELSQTGELGNYLFAQVLKESEKHCRCCENTTNTLGCAERIATNSNNCVTVLYSCISIIPFLKK